MTRGLIFGVIAMATIVVASNILVQFLLGDWLTWGAFTYPFAFLVTDLMNRLYGAKQARQVVLFGFGIGLICSIIGTQIIGEFGPLVSIRIAIGSGLAFLIAQLVDVAVFNRLRSGAWWRAPVISSLVGSALDTAIFFSVAFSGALVVLDPTKPNIWARDIVPLLGAGPELPLWVSLGIADFGVKMVLIMIALIPFRILVNRVKLRVS
ncbi:MAG: queuosine precursor transporter [Rhodobacteraceae bacterium]|nr:queuosine precursor transporter [Paracoccaceae bacterium]